MKKAFILLTVILAVFLIACGEEVAEWTVSEYSPSDKASALSATDALSNTIVYTPDANPIDDYFDYYLGDTALLAGITDYVYFTSAETAVAEAGVFKVKDQETANALLEAFGKRAENLAVTFENYSPEDTAIAMGVKISSFDDIVWFVASADNDSVMAVITE